MDTTGLPVEQSQEEGIKEALIRLLESGAKSYRVFSHLFLRPLTTEEIEDTADADFIAVANDLEGADLLAEGLNDMGRALNRRNDGTQQELASDYNICFTAKETNKEEVAIPRACVFIGEEELLNLEPYNEAYRLFRAEKIGKKTGVDLPEDHLSLELEFLAILSERAAQALEADNREEAIRCLELSREFITDHILVWYDSFRELALKILITRFYQGAIKATKGYLEYELQVIADMLEAIEVSELEEKLFASGQQE
ncbi:MAG: molecular chaperone TorD family protein [Coriobacteriia bacterium]|nr:molecular chaperone TorD family protein [Coriobacteriia bacterium]